MNVDQLIEMLTALSESGRGELTVILAKDEEGNAFFPLGVSYSTENTDLGKVICLWPDYPEVEMYDEDEG